jgi:hypothetical protein
MNGDTDRVEGVVAVADVAPPSRNAVPPPAAVESAWLADVDSLVRAIDVLEKWWRSYQASDRSVAWDAPRLLEVVFNIQRSVATRMPEIPTGPEDDDARAPGLTAQGRFALDLHEVLGGLEALLLEKHATYRQSHPRPLRIFSRASIEEQIKVLLDDELSKLGCGAAADEDVELEILGHLLILRSARMHAKRSGR